MPASSYTQSTFLGGEFSIAASGRLDLPLYPQALALCQNAVPNEEGNLTRRPGTRFVQPSYGGFYSNLIPFTVAQNVPYVLEVTFDGSDSWLRTISGGHLVNDGQYPAVSAISIANPAELTLSAAVTWSTGDTLQLQVSPTGIAGVDAAVWAPLVNRQFTATKVDTTHFTIADMLTGATIDGAQFTGTQPTILAGRVVRQQLNYGALSEIKTLYPIPAEGICILISSNGGVPQAPQVVWIDTPATSSAYATFSNGTLNFIDGPYLDPIVSTNAATLGGTSGTVSFTATNTTGINGNAGFQALDVGRQIRFRLSPPVWDSMTTYGASGSVVTFNGLQYTSINGGVTNLGLQPDTDFDSWAILPNAAIWYWGTIQTITSTTEVQILLSQTVVSDYTLDTWRLGLYTANGNIWPQSGTYYEGRVFLGGAAGNRLDTSMTGGLGAPNNLTMSPTDAFGNVLDADGISYTFLGPGSNQIFWMLPDSQGVIAGTESGEWHVQASALNDPITPNSFQAHQVTNYGSSYVLPVRTGIAINFVNRYNSRLIEYLIDPFSQKFSGKPLNLYAKHLSKGGIGQLSYSEDPTPIIWATTGTGFIGCTYRRVSYFATEQPAFYGWHGHTMGHGRAVGYIAGGFSADGAVDNLYMSTTDGTYFYSEYLPPPFDETNSLYQAQQVDGGVTGINYVNNPVTFEGGFGVDDGGSNIIFSGLYYLAGKTVSVFLGGLDCGDYVVQTGGYITVPYASDAGGLCTQAYLKGLNGVLSEPTDPAMSVYFQTGGTKIIPCIIGSTFTTQIKRLRPNTGQDVQINTGGSGLLRRHSWYSLLVGAGITGSVMVGGDENLKLYPAVFSDNTSGQPVSNFTLFSGVHRDTIEDDYNLNGQLYLEINRPVPFILCGFTGFLEANEINK